MGGGLMQLVAYGAQDIYLTGNPQITFFKVVYRRHTNFSMETIEQTINGGVSLNGNSTVTISRNGDLVYKIYVTGGAATAATTNGSAIVSEVELEIGGQRIDRHYEEWNQIWNELSTPESKAVGLKAMQGDLGTSGADATTGVKLTQYPLNFWFCRNPGLALPLIALQYHEVKLKFSWGSTAAKGVDGSIKVMCDYIYLDTDERRRFAQVSHEYLIEQVQKQTSGGTASEKLNFNHPVKELIWTSQASGGYTTAQLKLNGHDRFSAQNEEYFTLRQPIDHHTAVPRQNLPSSAQLTSNYADLTTKTIVTAPLSSILGVDDTGWNAVGAGNMVVGHTELTGGTTDATYLTWVATDSLLDLTVSTAEALKFNEIGFAFTDAEATAMFTVGSLFQITAYGTRWLDSSSDTDTTTATTQTARVTALVNSGGVGAVRGLDTADTIVFFDRVLLQGNGAIVAGNINITEIKEVIAQTSLVTQSRTSQLTKKINCYSFALKPEEHQPSGTCNFSRIDNAKLDFSGGTPPTSSENIYAVNYNVLRIMSGMGGLAYSN
jgi:hypothetical protein